MNCLFPSALSIEYTKLSFITSHHISSLLPIASSFKSSRFLPVSTIMFRFPSVHLNGTTYYCSGVAHANIAVSGIVLQCDRICLPLMGGYMWNRTPKVHHLGETHDDGPADKAEAFGGERRMFEGGQAASGRWHGYFRRAEKRLSSCRPKKPIFRFVQSSPLRSGFRLRLPSTQTEERDGKKSQLKNCSEEQKF